MATYPIPFGYAEWPEPKRRQPVALDRGDDAFPTATLHLTVPVVVKELAEAKAAGEGIPFEAWVARTLARNAAPSLTVQS